MLTRASIHEEDLVDLHGKVAIVTGGNTGIGYAIVQFLARKGAKVYMAARHEGRAAEAIGKLEAEGLNDGSVHWLNLDLSDPRLAKRAGEEILAKEQRLDILVNSAARGAFGHYTLDKDGLLDIMVTNHISHFVLTDTVLPLMKSTSMEEGSDVRIVNISSMSHRGPKPDTFIGKESLNKDYGPSVSECLDTYGNSKLANILHIKELQRRLTASAFPITCLAVHPGAVRTTGADGFLAAVPYVGWLLKACVGPLFFRTWRSGAMTPAFAAAGRAVRETREKYRGVYLEPVARVVQPSEYALDERLARELWETTEGIVRELGLA